MAETVWEYIKERIEATEDEYLKHTSGLVVWWHDFYHSHICMASPIKVKLSNELFDRFSEEELEGYEVDSNKRLGKITYNGIKIEKSRTAGNMDCTVFLPRHWTGYDSKRTGLKELIDQ